MKIWNADAASESRNFGVVPLDRKREWSAAENAEIVCVVGVFPNVFTGENQITSECLLESCVKFISPSGAKRSWR